ncbi:hypothetical protein L873DRAFT_573291 [Choiromyces venosus 120613-1]|uniref:Uncharacterized protein n=1 Tax=Choiromyces venosus 120613-1 TaxID=1336337 RepID=A0A3N4JXR6_9PEZI|nr:hypothetical protein L873DRAFT_573291 [Choiromyces venosus 120613-1]
MIPSHTLMEIPLNALHNLRDHHCAIMPLPRNHTSLKTRGGWKKKPGLPYLPSLRPLVSYDPSLPSNCFGSLDSPNTYCAMIIIVQPNEEIHRSFLRSRAVNGGSMSNHSLLGNTPPPQQTIRNIDNAERYSLELQGALVVHEFNLPQVTLTSFNSG